MKLDSATLPSATTTTVRHADAPSRAEALTRATDFEALLQRRQADERQSLQQDLLLLGEVGSVEPSLFSTSRALELLEHVREHIVPALDTDPQTRALADAVIGQEIEWRQLLDGYRREEEV